MFPFVPKSTEDVGIIMFPRRDIKEYIEVYDNKALISDIAATVFEDIARNGEATLRNIVDLFSRRYYYHKNGDTWSWLNSGPYFGTDPKLLKELEKLHIEEEKMEQKSRQKEENILKKYNMYVSSQEIWHTYTEEQRQEYWKKLDDFQKTNEEHKGFKAAYWDHSNKRSRTLNEIRDELALIDAKAFVDRNEGLEKKPLYIFSYSDNDGDLGIVMEHGDIFKNVPHVRISQH